MAENSGSAQGKRSRRLAAYVGAAVVLVVVLYFVPSLFLRSYVEDYLSENGMVAEGLDEVDFNVFNLGLETGPLTILRQGNVIADLDGLTLFLDLAPLMRQRIDVTGARLEGLTLTVEQDDEGTIGVKDLPDFGGADNGSEPLAWLFGLTSLELANATVNLELDQISGPLVVENFLIQNLKTWTPETPGSLALKARFFEGSIAGLLRVRPFTDVLDLDFDLEIENFPLERTSLGVPAAGKATVALIGDIAAGEHIQVTAKGSVGLSDGSYEIEGRTASVAQVDVNVSELLFRQEPETLRYSGLARLDASDIALRNGENVIASLDELSLDSVQASPEGDVSITQAELTGIKALRPEGERGINVDSVSITPITMASGGAFSLGNIRIGRLSTHLTLTENGIAELALLDEPEGQPSRESESTEDAGPAFAANIDSLSLGETGKLIFTDQTLAEPRSFELEITSLEIGGVDGTNPEAPTDISLATKLGEYTTLDLAGWIKPLVAEGPDFDLKGSLAKLEMPLISDYAAGSVGMHLRAGRLDMEFEGVAAGGTLDANTDWLIQRIELEELDAFDKAKLSEQTNVPIEKAVDLLQNKDGNIKLKIPINGALDDPEFDLSGTISKAIGKAVQGALVATLKIAFPIALLADIGGKDGELAFEPIAFGAGSVALDDGSAVYVSSIAELLNARPNLTLLVCGVAGKADLATLRMPAQEKALAESRAAAAPFLATPQDEAGTEPPEIAALRALEAIDPMAAALSEPENETLLALAQSRQASVRGTLVDTHGVENDRIFDCRSRVSVEDDAPPSVDVRL